MKKIEVFDRYKKTFFQEKVYGEESLRWAYNSRLGRCLTSSQSLSQFVSEAYGLYKNTEISAKNLKHFISQYSIDMSEYLNGSNAESTDNVSSYRSFNEFFIRKFKSSARSFNYTDKLCSPAEGRFFAYDKVDSETKIPVKGDFINPVAVLPQEWASSFTGGPMVLMRLCPVDYHRFHFPISGEIIGVKETKGTYHSVHPIALKNEPKIFSINKRTTTLLNTVKGKMALVAVGAMMVGKIHLNQRKGRISQGQEHGYFLFGGSTVMLYGQKGHWLPGEDLLENTQKGIETFVKLGDVIGE